jgi:hypothetical protein
MTYVAADINIKEEDNVDYDIAELFTENEGRVWDAKKRFKARKDRGYMFGEQKLKEELIQDDMDTLEEPFLHDWFAPIGNLLLKRTM